MEELEAEREQVAGNVYLWRLGELDAETAMAGIRAALGGAA